MNKGKPLTAVMTGRWLEFGTEEQPAEPWMTPAFMSSKEKALSTVVEELNKGIDRAIAKVSKGAR
jgi:HK97 gp10 family phage protein